MPARFHHHVLHLVWIAAFGCSSGTEDSATQKTSSSTPLLSEDFVGQLSRSDACADTRVHFWDEADQVGMTIYAEGILQQAHQDGAFSEAADLTHSAWSVQVEVATEQVSVSWCVDEYSDRDILGTYRATEGTLQLDVVPAESGEGGRVDVNLSDIVLVEESDGHRVRVPTWQWNDINVSASWGG
jgi:hypothetical protein